MSFNIVLTWSKIIAIIALVMGFVLELKGFSGVFFATLPTVIVLITGKQVVDNIKK